MQECTITDLSLEVEVKFLAIGSSSMDLLVLLAGKGVLTFVLVSDDESPN